MKQRFTYLILVIAILSTSALSVSGQDDSEFICTADALANFIADETADLDSDGNNPAYIYRLGALYTEFALLCGYQPDLEEVETQIERTLDLAPLSFIIAASSIGNDVDSALLELETVHGDSFNGQLLYNGLEMGLDGAELGCSGCHNGEAAPLVEATFTRTEEERLILAEFADYDIERYLVESILHPAGYIVPEYSSVQMPANYGGRLDAQQLADLVAYLESQDQLLDEASADSGDSAYLCDALSTLDCDVTLAEYTGDATQGEALYNGREVTENDLFLGCAGCHTGGVIGPATIGTWTRINEERLILAEYTDYSPERFLIESIFIPGNFVPDTFADNVMPQNYANQLSYQDLADIIAYLQESG